MPALEEVLSPAQGESESIAKSFGRSKTFVPSHSHPSAGEHSVMGLLTAPIDHVADVFRKFPENTISPSTSSK
ncbi:HHE domain-containing protein [Verticillium alfalfae VaMs.102]|uniref:HHE domain-containing protein n=1 Tax=Verticillium alfalfae (strain VaMs.102 / ATCC MYA-4576 / FGSC 10136) TaxID=526221 RepID=C9SJV1_VERA1|nr:HHE domain-containing protein [Verticillium alfalfae VaMs.102]EEY19715.1 HHE domain-containing protein [Verticillium alfalfae VaMs.102]